MQNNQFRQHWNQIKTQLSHQYSDVPRHDIEQINGDYNRCLETLQRHGYSRSQVEREIEQITSQIAHGRTTQPLFRQESPSNNNKREQLNPQQHNQNNPNQNQDWKKKRKAG